MPSEKERRDIASGVAEGVGFAVALILFIMVAVGALQVLYWVVFIWLPGVLFDV